MTGSIRSTWMEAALALAFGVAVVAAPARAQQSEPAPNQPQSPAQSPGQTAPAQHTPPDQPGPDQASPSAQPSQSSGQTFTGVVTKAGDKYVLQDSDSGTTYDIDHQDEVKKFEGKKVRVHGTLDPNGKMIHVQ